MPAIPLVFAALAAAAPAIGEAALIGGGIAIAGASSAASAKKAAEAQSDELGALKGQGTTVANESTSDVNNLGSAALIGTSPLGVQGFDSNQRYKLLGN